MPTLYDNFSQVRQYIDENNTSYVTKTELANCSYVTSDVKELIGPLYITYQETNNALYGLKSYSHIVAGDENKTMPAFLASKRYCANGVGSYVNMASFFVNSDGRAKFGHKASAGGGGDDSFMCFNAYGFKIAYSGTAGTSATTEYEILHEGNIGNLGYATQTYVADYVAEHGGGGSTVIDENIIPKETSTYTLGDSTYLYAATYTNDLYYSGKISYISDKTKLIMNDRNIDIYANNKKLVNVSDYSGVVPMQTDVNLGSSSSVWANTYTENLYSPSLVLSYSYNSIDNASNTQINFKVNQWNRMKLTNTALMPSTNNGIRLGDSGAQWSSTYVRDLYLNGTNIEDRFTYLVWTGTSAEYEALSDYTTYQFYLIQES